ncbi:3-oxosteroid 1-dehydrogenase [Variovorax sp. CF079]|uniref:FAD-binding protein n=1 Tax=Variovorax sp. CF079 TaxID=1882774 RepID=UPI00088C38BF|nr:FAD-binding protein [Variovorax sp. CF079]SDC48998.1 3-oxosteroid 1-dehydrogenase [Variovorax sp. CF079]
MSTNGTWDEAFDFVIVGSGGGSMCAALAAKQLGKRALIVEKQPLIGGSTGFSGGVWWVPNNPVMKRAGVADSAERARQYLDAAVTYQGPGTSPARRDAFLRNGPKMVQFLEGQGMKFVYADGWSDYYDELPGGEPRGRSLLAELFDTRELGEWESKLSRYKGFSLPLPTDQFPSLMLAKRTWGGKKTALSMVGRMLKAKLTGRRLAGAGAAIQGRMLQIALREQLPIWTDSALAQFVLDGDRVAGIAVQRGGRLVRVQARDGVLMNVGGFSRSAAMRQRFQPQPNSATWTNANPGDTGEAIEWAMALGAAVDCMDEAWWVVTSLAPDGQPPKPGGYAADGTPLPFMHHLDLSLPYSMMVDQLGERFCDEAGAYMEIGQRMYQRQRETGKAVPSWVIMDSRQRAYYPWGTAQPGQVPEEWLKSGYMVKAESIDELVKKTGIDGAGLAWTLERFNGFCRSGVDSDFGRGSRAFDRCHGDPTVTPNPNLGAIEKPPFYAVRMYPGDVGTAGGVVTDEHARVLREDGSVIHGLYATGNCTASVVGRCYPGAGASIGASFTFGYIAAHHALGAPLQ